MSPDTRAEFVKAVVAKASEARLEASSRLAAAAELLKPALVVCHNIRNFDIEEINWTLHLGGGYNFECSFSDGDRGDYFVPADIAHSDNPAEAMALYKVQREARERAEVAARVEAQRQQNYRDAGLSTEDIAAVEAARLKLGAIGKTL